jgi:hypothetical protein
MYITFALEKEGKKSGLSLKFAKNLPKVNNRPIGKNAPT